MISYLFHKRRLKNYDCTDFTIEAAKLLLDKNLEDVLGLHCVPPLSATRKLKPSKKLPKTGVAFFRMLDNSLHVGLVWKYKILHLARTGVKWVEADLITEATTVKYYTIL